MKLLLYLLLLLLFILPACDRSQQAEAFRKKTAELNQREQDLLSREQLVEQQERELVRKQQVFDSVSRQLPDTTVDRHINDSLLLSHPQVPGLYNVTMKCTETNCTGSAVGDTKNEQWNIAHEQNFVVIRAMSDGKIIRIYKGNYLGGGIELEAQQDSSGTSPVGRIIVRLQETKDFQLGGVREIIRQDDCRIVYTLDLHKQ